jgi:HD-like signal output (HDOD) protein
MEQLFVSKNEVVKKYMAKMWIDTIDIVANAMAAMLTYQAASGKKNLNLDTITLSALVANIGALPVLTEAERHDSVFANPTFLDVAIEKLAGRIGGSIMREWQFNDVFIQCAEHWRNIDFVEPEITYIDFVRIGAALANQVDNGDEILTIALEKGIFDDVEVYQTPEFAKIRDNAKSIFA